jgi:hypothetical protein
MHGAPKLRRSVIDPNSLAILRGISLFILPLLFLYPWPFHFGLSSLSSVLAAASYRDQRVTD